MRTYAQQKAGLTRATKKGSEALIAECTRTVAEWNTGKGSWPDDWSRWQRALDDSLPFGQAPELDSLVRTAARYVECDKCGSHSLRLLETEYVCGDCSEELDFDSLHRQLDEGRVIA